MVNPKTMNTGTSAKRLGSERILLVDNNGMGLRARKVVLEELGYEVTGASCSAEALQHFSTQSYSLVVTDYKMPQLNGIELIARMRESVPSVPIIMISGFAETLGLNEGNTGANVVIQKNSHEVLALTRAVTRLLTRKPPRKPVRVQTTLVNRAVVARRY